jgi:hypothetical protein
VEEAMDRSDIAEAVVLFQFSNTAMQNVRARTVLQKLQYLYRRNEIGFYTLPRRSLRGTWREGRAGHDLRLNTAYFERIPEANRLAGLSLTLVHEATHATVDFTRLYDEMAARLMPIHYFRELSGPGVFNEANDPQRPGRGPRVVRLPAGSFPEYEEMSEAVRNDQLVDYVLSIRNLHALELHHTAVDYRKPHPLARPAESMAVDTRTLYPPSRRQRRHLLYPGHSRYHGKRQSAQ